MDDLLTIDAVAKRLAVSRRTVYTMVHAGQIETVRVGRLLRIAPAAVDAYIRAHRHQPAQRAIATGPVLAVSARRAAQGRYR